MTFLGRFLAMQWWSSLSCCDQQDSPTHLLSRWLHLWGTNYNVYIIFVYNAFIFQLQDVNYYMSQFYLTLLSFFRSSRNTTIKVQVKYMSGKWLFSNAVFLKPILWSTEKKKTFQITKDWHFCQTKLKKLKTPYKKHLIITKV